MSDRSSSLSSVPESIPPSNRPEPEPSGSSSRLPARRSPPLLSPERTHTRFSPPTIPATLDPESSPGLDGAGQPAKRRRDADDDQKPVVPAEGKSGSNADRQAGDAPKKAKIAEEPAHATLVQQAQTSQADSEAGDAQSMANLTCAICLFPPSPLVVSKCGHVTCGGCLTASFSSQQDSYALLHRPRPDTNSGKCPVCRAALVGGWGVAMRGAILKMGKST